MLVGAYSMEFIFNQERNLEVVFKIINGCSVVRTFTVAASNS